MGRIILLLLLTIVTTQFSLAQTGSIRGRVEVADGQPASEVNVELKGTSRGASTGSDGRYTIEAVREGAYVLVLTFVGWQTREVPVNVRAGQVTEVPVVVLQAGPGELREVVVQGARQGHYTAQEPSRSLRINTPLVQTPQNIQVITREVIASQQTFDMLEGIQRNVSGAQKVEHWDNYARINMRGSQITAFRNGMNVQMPWGPLAEDMSMVERIEFVKGPAGFMLAGGEPGGFYNVVTKKPTGIFRGEATVTLGRYDMYRAAADIDGRLSNDGSLLYRLNLMGQL